MTLLPHSVGTNSKPTIEALSRDCLAEVAAFIATESGKNREEVELHLRWFWLSNPAIQPGDPLGFTLRSATRIVGCILCIPQSFHCADQKINFMGSSSFYVNQEFHGQGGRLFLQYSRLGKSRPLFGTSANGQAAALWKAAGATPIPHSDCELFGILQWPPILEEIVHRRYSNRWLDRIAASPIFNAAKIFSRLRLNEKEAGSLRILKAPEEADAMLRHQSQRKLTSSRAPEYLRWRYFSGQEPSAGLFAFRTHLSHSETLVAVNRRSRGYRGQVRSLNILDVYPEPSPSRFLQIIAALINRYRSDVDVIVLRNQNLEIQGLLAARGFRRRAFEAPTSWILDRSKLLPTCDWYFVPADGDSLI